MYRDRIKETVRSRKKLKTRGGFFVIMHIFKGSRIYKITLKKIRLLVAMCFAFFTLKLFF